MKEKELTQEADVQSELSLKITRRKFLKIVGGGIAFFFSIGDPSILEAQRRRRGYPTDFNAYFLIKTDGKISCFSGKVELGQGAMTSLAQAAAEELEAPLESFEMIMGDTDLCPYDSGTYGSMTTRFFWPALKSAAAEVRAVLMKLASEHLSIPVERLAVEKGLIFERRNRNKSVTYAELAKGEKISLKLDGSISEKEIPEYKIIGQPTARIDAREKVTGAAKYAGDIRYPGMVYARILRPPAHRAQIDQIDTSAAERMEGVTVVREDDLVAVLHEDPEIASKALGTIKADFEIPEEGTNQSNIFEHLLRNAPEGSESEKRGSIAAGEKESVELFDEEYLNSYVAHAPVETHTAVAVYKDNKVEVWVSTQAPFGDQGRIARALGIPSENVRVKTPYVGGGFGGKTSNRQAVEAARISKITGKPVQVAWTRAEEFFYDTFRPAAIVKIRSGIDGNGRISLWDYKVYLAGSRGSGQFYDIPNNLITACGSGWTGPPGSHPFATGPWRAPANNTNTFARESQIDIMATKAGIDPLQFRLNNLKDQKMIGVLKATADKFGWPPSKGPSGRGFGMACGIDVGTYVAAMAEVEVDRSSGQIKVKKVTCAQDMGLVVNPAGAESQMEGCITMGLGYALSEEIRFKGGQIFDTNFDTYEITQFSWIPEIETVLVETGEAAPQGGGEPAIIFMGALIANAVFDATGARLYQLPMTPQRVKESLSG